jgi:hypothetical protein
VGFLSGKDIIRHMSDLKLADFQQYYAEAEAHAPPQDARAHAHLGDPLPADTFGDEMVDIDFGAIDAFTEALHHQILAEQKGLAPPKDLHFPSHVIASSHAAFLENQLFLADTSPAEETNNGKVSLTIYIDNFYCQFKTNKILFF